MPCCSYPTSWVDLFDKLSDHVNDSMKFYISTCTTHTRVIFPNPDGQMFPVSTTRTGAFVGIWLWQWLYRRLHGNNCVAISLFGNESVSIRLFGYDFVVVTLYGYDLVAITLYGYDLVAITLYGNGFCRHNIA